MKIPLSVYDFFGYLASGFILLLSVNIAFSQDWLFKSDQNLVMGLSLIFVAYIIGHAVAHLSWAILEEWFVRKVLHSPEETLFIDEYQSRWKRIFPCFYKPLPSETQKIVFEKTKKANISSPGQGLFFHCHPIVMRDSAARERLSSFLNLYGFSRNLVLAGFLSSLILLIGSFRDIWSKPRVFHPDTLGWSLVSIVIAVVMFYRYLKFFRLYTIEVFRTYAVIDDEKGRAT